MPKRRNSAYYSQLAKRRFANADSDISTRASVDTSSHVDSPRVSVDTSSHVDSPRVSVDTSSRMDSSLDRSSGTKITI